MTLGYLLDTNIISEALRPKPNQRVLANFKRHRSELAISAPVWHELLFGCHRLPPSRKRSEIEDYLRSVVAETMPILPYDARSAVFHASERARLTAAGRTPSYVDGQIAAIASVNDLTLITLNTKDYRDFHDLSIDDWL